MACEACIQSAKQQRRSYLTTVENAKQYAQDKQTQVVVFEDPLEGWTFTTLEQAIQNGIPFREVFSQH